MVAYALSRKSSGNLSYIHFVRIPLLLELRALNVELAQGEKGALLTTLKVRPVLIDRVREAQNQNEQMVKIKEQVQQGNRVDFVISEDGTLLYRSRLYVPNVEVLKREIIEEAHNSTYAMHSGSTKMYRTLKDNY